MNWISVKERLPKDRTECLVYLESLECAVTYYHKGFYIGSDYVTHWMPLPEPSKNK